MEKPMILEANLTACTLGGSAVAVAGLSPLVIAACGGIAAAIA